MRHGLALAVRWRRQLGLLMVRVVDAFGVAVQVVGAGGDSALTHLQW